MLIFDILPDAPRLVRRVLSHGGRLQSESVVNSDPTLAAANQATAEMTRLLLVLQQRLEDSHHTLNDVINRTGEAGMLGEVQQKNTRLLSRSRREIELLGKMLGSEYK